MADNYSAESGVGRGFSPLGVKISVFPALAAPALQNSLTLKQLQCLWALARWEKRRNLSATAPKNHPRPLLKEGR